MQEEQIKKLKSEGETLEKKTKLLEQFLAEKNKKIEELKKKLNIFLVKPNYRTEEVRKMWDETCTYNVTYACCGNVSSVCNFIYLLNKYMNVYVLIIIIKIY